MISVFVSLGNFVRIFGRRLSLYARYAGVHCC